MKRATSIIRRLRHLGIFSLLSYSSRALELISKKFLSNPCLRVFQIVMPPRRVGRGRLPRRYVDEQELPYAPGVQPQGEVSNAEFRAAIRILSQAVPTQIG